jgi:hypothetical protein
LIERFGVLVERWVISVHFFLFRSAFPFHFSVVPLVAV